MRKECNILLWHTIMWSRKKIDLQEDNQKGLTDTARVHRNVERGDMTSNTWH